ncbi:hypothetical protein [Azospirillum brasilense]|uniref:hypothetical protein n=1 Tax=Azospirillum brasilense TaxID=192 RepID=UPI000E0A74CA|nr:hypothetical protein [Azospirillum brasilense]
MTARIDIDHGRSKIVASGRSLAQVNVWCMAHLGMPLWGFAMALTARIPVARVLCRVVNGDKLMVRLRVFTLTGADGVAVRRIDPINLHVYNTLLKVSNRARRGALTHPIHQNFYLIYRMLGIHRIDLHAALTMGGYVWAKSGFLPDSPSAWRSLANRLLVRWGAERSSVDSMTYRLVERILNHPSPTSLRELVDPRFRHPPSGHSVGRFLLEGESWTGFLDLTNRESVTMYLSETGVLP